MRIEPAVVDASVLYAVADTSDTAHRRCREVLEGGRLRLFVPAMVVAEATYLIGSRLGSLVEADFLAGLTDFEVEMPYVEEWPRIAELVRTYRDFPLGGTDASVVVLAERLGTDLVMTLDRRHFGAVRPRHVAAFRLVPE